MSVMLSTLPKCRVSVHCGGGRHASCPIFQERKRSRRYSPLGMESLSITRQQHVASSSTEELRSPDGSNTVFGFQCNERHLKWDESATRQLIKIWVAEQLEIDLDATNRRLAELSVLLPDLLNELEKMKAGVVLELCRDTEAVAKRLMELKEVLPGVNISFVLAGNLWLLKEPDVELVSHQMQKLTNAISKENANQIIESEPRVLLADLDFVFAELKRLLPGIDPKQALLTHGSMVLTMDQAGMPPSLLIDDGIGK